MTTQMLRANQTAIARSVMSREDMGHVVVARWRLLDVLQSGTLIGVFHSSEAAAVAVESMEKSSSATRIWKACGRVMGRDLREEWEQRSFFRRVLGFGDERRVVESLARDLEAGSTLVAVRPRDGSTGEELLPGATHLIRVGAWSFGFIR